MAADSGGRIDRLALVEGGRVSPFNRDTASGTRIPDRAARVGHRDWVALATQLLDSPSAPAALAMPPSASTASGIAELPRAPQTRAVALIYGDDCRPPLEHKFDLTAQPPADPSCGPAFPPAMGLAMLTARVNSTSEAALPALWPELGGLAPGAPDESSSSLLRTCLPALRRSPTVVQLSEGLCAAQ